VPVLPAGKLGQKKGDGTRADFWIPDQRQLFFPLNDNYFSRRHTA
jgi:hypothetical protein